VPRNPLRTLAGTGIVAAVAPLSAWAGLAAGFVLALAAALRMAGAVAEADQVVGVIRLPGPVTTVVVSLFALALLVFLGDLVRRTLSRERRPVDGPAEDEPAPVPAWIRRITMVFSLVNVALLAYLWRRAVLEGGLFAGMSGLAAGLDLPAGETLTAPALYHWIVGALAVAAGAGALGLALWSALGDRLHRRDEEPARPPEAPLVVAVEESLDDLRGEGDARRAIVRCYARFERAAAAAGLPRRPWLTPGEFMREALARLPLPRAAVPTLTGLFELARFSDRALGARERDRAVDALTEIRRAMEASAPDGRPV
jgi:hypothetical protein